jgi:hypothetical protein
MEVPKIKEFIAFTGLQQSCFQLGFNLIINTDRSRNLTDSMSTLDNHLTEADGRMEDIIWRLTSQPKIDRKQLLRWCCIGNEENEENVIYHYEGLTPFFSAWKVDVVPMVEPMFHVTFERLLMPTIGPWPSDYKGELFVGASDALGALDQVKDTIAAAEINRLVHGDRIPFETVSMGLTDDLLSIAGGTHSGSM